MNDKYNDKADDNLDSGKEISLHRILIRDRYDTFVSAVITNITLAGQSNGININSDDFAVDTSETFNPNILLECTGALLHNMSPSDMIRLVNFLKVYPEKIKTIVLEGTYASTPDHRKLYSILKAMGIKILYRPIVDLSEMNQRVLGIEG